jgi:hypothetical protein
VGLWAGMDVVVRRKIPSPYRDSKPQSYSPEPRAIPLSNPGYLQFILLQKMLKVCTSMLHTLPSKTRVHRYYLHGHKLNVGNYVGYVGFQFIQIVWVIVVGIV